MRLALYGSVQHCELQFEKAISKLTWDDPQLKLHFKGKKQSTIHQLVAKLQQAAATATKVGETVELDMEDVVDHQAIEQRLDSEREKM